MTNSVTAGSERQHTVSVSCFHSVLPPALLLAMRRKAPLWRLMVDSGVAVLVYNRPGHRESFARAVKELNLPVDVQKPDFSEDFLEVIKSERDERNRNIWVFQVPEKTEEQ